MPASAPQANRSLVLAFHGAGSSADDMLEFTGLCDTADREGFVVAFPNGTGRVSSSCSWNAADLNVHASRNKIDDVGFVQRLLDELTTDCAVDPTRCYAAGMSNGGLLCYRLAAEIPGRIAAIFVVGCAAVSLDYDPPVPTPIVHVHGSEDTYVPLEGGVGTSSFTKTAFLSVEETVAFWAEKNGCESTPLSAALPKGDDGMSVERVAYRTPDATADVTLYKIIGGGHTWPGHPSKHDFLGPTTMQFDANDLLWQFCQQHRRGTEG